jgi:hypothetical protein
MQSSASDANDKSDRRSWIIVTCLALGFFLWGLLIFFTVGTRPPPPWGFGNIEDVPGESYYSTHKVDLELGTSKGPPQQRPVEAQHVDERPLQPEEMQQKEGK